MKKLYSLICVSLIGACYANAQNIKPAYSSQDKINYKGYTIKLLPAAANTYGYNVLKGKELLIHQVYNPFTMSPVGLRKKQDAYDVAKWQIEQLGNNKPLRLKAMRTARIKPNADSIAAHNSAIINQPLPVSVAQQLNINIK